MLEFTPSPPPPSSNAKQILKTHHKYIQNRPSRPCSRQGELRMVGGWGRGLIGSLQKDGGTCFCKQGSSLRCNLGGIRAAPSNFDTQIQITPEKDRCGFDKSFGVCVQLPMVHLREPSYKHLCCLPIKIIKQTNHKNDRISGSELQLNTVLLSTTKQNSTPNASVMTSIVGAHYMPRHALKLGQNI